MLNDQIYISSINKAIVNAKIYGTLDLTILNLFYLINYYIKFTDDLKSLNISLYNEGNIKLKKLAADLIYKYPKVLCNYKTVANDGTYIINISTNNTAPTVSAGSINFGTEAIYTFKISDFTTDFNDVNGNSYNKLLIYLDSDNGTYRYNNIIVTDTIEIPVGNVINLTLTRPDNLVYNDVLQYRISDNHINSLYSILTNITLTGTAITVNEQATIGDNVIYVNNRITTILTLAMFTDELSPPYNDPEGDLIDAIRIDTISASNQGTYYINGLEITIGLIVTREDLIANLFSHVGPNENSLSFDLFTFSARDEGSQIWVN
jgi:hypothetical protein